MKQYGDITKIKGNETPLVDIITGGSPCQDLSIAGKRAGLDGERSGLFMEQIRIVKEQRNESSKRLSSSGTTIDIRHIQPRYMVWENVAGAFSSNNGDDFRVVLEEICKVADQNANVPKLEKGQRWANAGCIVGDGYSVAWRLHDAQYWGVPQRRKRICVLADFNGESAPKILFELVGEAEYSEANKAVADFGEQSRSEVQSFSESVSGHFEQGRETGQGIAGTSENSFDQTGGGGIRTFDVRISSEGTKNQRAHCYETDRSRSLDTGGENPDSNHGGVTIIQRRFSNVNTFEDGISPTLEAGAGEGGNNMPLVFEPSSASRVGGHVYDDATGSLRANAGDNQQAVCYGISAYESNSMKSDNPHSGVYEADTSRTLDLNGGSPACNQGGVAVVCIEGNGTRDSHKGDGYKESDTMYTLNTVETHAVAYEASKHQCWQKADEALGTLTAEQNNHVRGDTPLVAYGLDRASFNQGQNAQFNFSVDEELAPPLIAKGPGGYCPINDTVGALCAVDYKGAGNQYVNDGKCIIQRKG